MFLLSLNKRAALYINFMFLICPMHRFASSLSFPHSSSTICSSLIILIFYSSSHSDLFSFLCALPSQTPLWITSQYYWMLIAEFTFRSVGCLHPSAYLHARACYIFMMWAENREMNSSELILDYKQNEKKNTTWFLLSLSFSVETLNMFYTWWKQI